MRVTILSQQAIVSSARDELPGVSKILADDSDTIKQVIVVDKSDLMIIK